MTRFTVELPPGNAAPAEARHALAAKLPPEIAAAVGPTLRLLVSELVTNSVRHAPTSRPGDVALDIHIRGDTIRVAVRDTGGGFDPTPAKPRGADGGFGLFLVEKMATRWGIEGDPGTCVWFELDVLATA